MIAIETVINWFRQREGKVTYSMVSRNGPSSYDCSSAVFYALIQAGFLPASTAIGNTDSLYRFEGSLLLPISRAQVQRGDIFVAGNKNGSGGAGGHTGVFLSSEKIIHCNYASNGIAETLASGRMGEAAGLPVYFYRLKGSSANQERYTLTGTVNGYQNAEDARNGKNPKTIVKAGSYFVFNAWSDAVNVTTVPGVPGSWIKKMSGNTTNSDMAKFKVGQKVTLLNKASQYQTGEAVPNWVKNKSYSVTQIKKVKQSQSTYAYLLRELMSWVLEQDLS